MNEYLFWFWVTVIAVLAIAVGFVLLKKFLQDRDAKRQIEGKEPYREFVGNTIPDSKEEILNNDFEIEKDRLRSQNLPFI